MGTGYVRADTANNIDANKVASASDIDGEFNAIVAAFNASTGHTHDGTTAEGAPITVIGPAQEYVADGTSLKPKTDNTYDLGTSSAEWKDLYIDGVAYLDQVDIDSGEIDGTPIGANTASTGAFTEATAENYVNTVHTLSGTTPALNPANGNIQTWTLTGNSTPTDGLTAGEFIILLIDDGTAYTITWPTITWLNNGGSAPTLATSGYTVVTLVKLGSTLYGVLNADGT